MELMTVSELGNQARLASLPIFLSFVGLVVLLSDLVFNREDEQRWPAYLTIAGLVGGLFLWLQSWLVYHQPQTDNAFFGTARRLLGVQPLPQPEALFNAMYDPVGVGNMTLLVSLIVVIVALVVVLIAPPHLERHGIQRGEFYALILFCTVGLIFMAGSTHLIMIFLGIELLSLPLYILAGFARPDLRSMESALKYFLLGAFASAFLLYGIALTYGATGSMDVVGIREITLQALQTQTQAPSVLGVQGGTANLMLLAGFTMILVGIGFKLALVPFHQWTPDVYEGAPLPVTAFMVAGTKVGAFAALINILGGFVVLFEWWTTLLVILAILTMVVGNIGAIRQRNIKRMLAYSSIAHAGYILVGLAGIGPFPLSAASTVFTLPSLILYLAVYALMNLGAFAVLIALEEATEREIIELEDFTALGRQHPVLGLLLGFFLLSLAGFPPTAGFFAKFFLFTGAVLGNQIGLVVLGTVLSVISIFYYARFIIAMFMTAPAGETAGAEHQAEPEPLTQRERPSWMVGAAVTVTALLVLGLGLFPTPFLNLFQ